MLSSVKHKDDAGFERNFSQLRTYYTDTRRELPCGLYWSCWVLQYCPPTPAATAAVICCETRSSL